jgi:hypothetical protein
VALALRKALRRMRAEHRANMGKLAAETEARMAIADVEIRARVRARVAFETRLFFSFLFSPG